MIYMWPRDTHIFTGIRPTDINVTLLPGVNASSVQTELISLYCKLRTIMPAENSWWPNFFKNSIIDFEKNIKLYSEI